MKARIKGTNTIVECIRIEGFFGEKGKGVYCKYINGEHPGAYETIPGDCLVELENDFDWQSFRNQAAKDILCGIVSHSGICISSRDTARLTKLSLEFADELVKQLKEKETC